jgi:hypothetical protein
MEIKESQISVLHHNVQSLWNKQLALAILLNSSLQGIDELRFTEHWLDENQPVMVGINKFKLVSKFCMKHSKNKESCISVHKELKRQGKLLF